MVFFFKILAWVGLFSLGHYFIKNGRKTPEIDPAKSIGVLAVMYGGIYFVWGLSRYLSLHTTIDLPIYLQALSNPQLYSAILNKSLLSLHFSPILYLFIPLFHLATSSVLLILIQAAVLAGASIPLYRIARRMNVTPGVSLLIVFIYLNYVYTWRLVFSDFHIEHLMPLAFFCLIDAFFTNRNRWFWIVLLACLGIKEDVGFYLATWALVMAVYLPDYRKRALAAALVSAVGAMLALFLVMYLNQGEYPYFAYWQNFGKGLAGIIAGALVQPWKSVAVLFKVPLLDLLISFAGLVVFSFWGWVLLVPAWVQLASNNTQQAQWEAYYAAPIIPFVFVALAAGWRKFSLRLAEHPRRRIILWGTAVFLLVVNFSGIAPYSVSLSQWGISNSLKKIPEKGVVVAQANLAPHIQRVRRVRILGINPINERTQAVAFFAKYNFWPMTPEDFIVTLEKMNANPSFEVITQESELVLFQRKINPDKLASTPVAGNKTEGPIQKK